MSKKRSSRNNNKVLKALRQKRANGGRLKAFGGIDVNIDDAALRAQVEANVRAAQSKQPSTPVTTQPSGPQGGSVTVGSATNQSIVPGDNPLENKEGRRSIDTGDVVVTNPTPTPTTTTTTTTPSTNDPEPRRNQYPGGAGGQNAWKRAHNAWKARQGENARNIDVTEGTGTTAGTAQQGNTMSTIPSTGSQPPKVEITPPEKFEIDEVETEDVSLEGTALGPAQQIGAQKAVTASTVAKAPTITADTATAATADMPTTVTAAGYRAEAAQDLTPTEAAQGVVSDEAIARAEGPTLTERAVAAERDTAQEQAALAGEVDFDISDGAYVDKVTGKTTDVAPTPEAEKNQREAITGQPATAGQAAEIIGIVGYEQIKNRSYSGRDAAAGATNMLSEIGNLPTNVSTSIVEDPATVEAQLDQQPVEVRAAVAALPTEALVSSQMESLLAGMEDGKTPAWARPAVAAIEQKLAARGLSASTVGRDALFNAIIQSALPMAQSNAQALQQRAAQNLSNEQQANLTQSTQDMQRRMANLANRQTAEGQTAQYAQQMSVLQSQFTQQGVMAEMQVANEFLARNAGFQQQMNLANLSNDQQMRLANLSALNQADSQNLTAAQQTELANLNTRMQTNLLQANLAQQMGVAQLNVDQQRAVQNAAMTARVDLTKFNADQQTALANSKFMQSMSMADFNAEQQAAMQNATMMAQMDLAAADQRTKLAITNAQSFLQMDMANLSNSQQATILDQQMRQQRILSDQSAANAAKQFNAASENQTNQFMASMQANMNQFNATQTNAMRQFNTAETNKARAMNAANTMEVNKANAAIRNQTNQFNAQIEFQRDQWNAANAQAVAQSNVEWRRKSNTINTAAANAANQQNAQMAFNLSSAEQEFLWQNLRDEAAYIRTAYENEEQRKTVMYSTALQNEAAAGKGSSTTSTLMTLIGNIFK